MLFRLLRCPQIYVYLAVYFIGLIVYYSVVASLKKVPYYWYLVHILFNVSMIFIYHIFCKYDYNKTCWFIVLFPIIYFIVFIMAVISNKT